MKKKLRIACIQNSAGSDWQQNLQIIDKLITQALRQKARLIALTEGFYCRGPKSMHAELAAEATPYVLAKYRKLAKHEGIAILMGSVLKNRARLVSFTIPRFSYLKTDSLPPNIERFISLISRSRVR